jgi:hypothetical protein
MLLLDVTIGNVAWPNIERGVRANFSTLGRAIVASFTGVDP